MPKNFKEAQAALNKVASRKPVNPTLIDWHTAAAVYMANAEKNPSLNAQENIFSRIGQLQANEIYQYMVIW